MKPIATSMLSYTLRIALGIVVTTFLWGGTSSHAGAQVTQGDTNANEEDNNNAEDSNTDDPNANQTGNVFIGNTAGISIDALGIVRRQLHGGNGALHRQRMAAAFAQPGREIVRSSELRMISLGRLERAIKRARAHDAPLSDDMLYLAGLTRVHYVFLYPDSGDVVVAGPASGWFDDGRGNVLSLKSQQPVLRLEDLAVALRAFPPHQQTDPVIACSIDPTPEGLARMQAYLKSINRHPPSAETIVKGLKKTLGWHSVTIGGIPANTRFAQVMVAADFRMKLIGIGMEQPPVDIPSYVSLARPTSRSDALARWYFTPNYQCIQMDKDELAVQLIGDGVRLISQAEFVAHNGTRHKDSRLNVASEKFVRRFTKMYAELARHSPVYAELRNLIDLTLVAAILQHLDAYGRCGWSPKLFLDEHRLAVQVHNVPERVATVATAVWKGRQLMTPVGGGVNIHPREALKQKNLIEDDGSVYARRASISFDNLAEERWWWD